MTSSVPEYSLATQPTRRFKTGRIVQHVFFIVCRFLKLFEPFPHDTVALSKDNTSTGMLDINAVGERDVQYAPREACHSVWNLRGVDSTVSFIGMM